MIPIWQDTFYYVPASASPFTYSLDISGQTIFNGKAWVAPDEPQIKIKINSVAQDYLSQDFPQAATSALTTYTHEDAVKTVELRDEDNNVLSSWTFVFDWSYEDVNYENSATTLSNPINGHATSDMWLYLTRAYNYGDEWVQTEKSKDASLIPIYKNEYCGDYALYYLNRKGGWDSFLVEGNVKQKDEYSRYSISTVYNNNNPMDWGKRNYNNQITPTWQVNSGWLSDRQSHILAHNLLSSNNIYFHNLETGKVIPVVLTDASAEYKNFKDQRKMVNYTINITASQTEQIVG